MEKMAVLKSAWVFVSPQAWRAFVLGWLLQPLEFSHLSHALQPANLLPLVLNRMHRVRLEVIL